MLPGRDEVVFRYRELGLARFFGVDFLRLFSVHWDK